MRVVVELWSSARSRRNEHQRCANKPAQGKRGTSAALGVAFKKEQSPEGAAHIVAPFQGFVREGQFSQGVALGWLVAGPLVLSAAPLPDVFDRPSYALIPANRSASTIFTPGTAAISGGRKRRRARERVRGWLSPWRGSGRVR